MTGKTFTRDAVDFGFSKVPNGLWTLPVTSGARVVLGWLWGHTDEFLASLTLNKCRRMLSTSSTKKYLEELEALGFVEIDREGPSWGFHLVGAAWVGLISRDHNRADLGSVDKRVGKSATEPTSAHPQADVGAPGSARVEDQCKKTSSEDQHSSPSATDIFESFWLKYPRKAGKPAAKRAFKAAVKRDGLTVIREGFRTWTGAWERVGTPEQFIPHPSTWLNQHRYHDKPADIEASARNRQASTMDLIDDYLKDEHDEQE